MAIVQLGEFSSSEGIVPKSLDRARAERLSDSDSPTLRFHRVEPGETLKVIAGRLYGDESFWVVLYEANRELLRENGEPASGETLYVPFL
jgi:nucleoid-associated protein YgaU